MRWRCPPESCGEALGCRRGRADQLAGCFRGRASGAGRRSTCRARPRVEPDLPARIERRVRVLEDELEPCQLTGAAAPPEGHDLPALEDDGSGRRADEPDRGPRERRLPAARFSDEADDLPPVDGDARAGDRPYPGPTAALVVDDDVCELERAHPAANGSTGQASARPFEAISSGTFTRQSSRAKAQRGLNAHQAECRPAGAVTGSPRAAGPAEARGGGARPAALACTGGAVDG